MWDIFASLTYNVKHEWQNCGPVRNWPKLCIQYHLICRTTGPQPLPKRVLQTVRSGASYFNFQYSLLSLRSSSSWICLLPRLPATCILPSIFPSITCFRRQFLHKMWRIQLAFLLYIVCWLFLSSSTLCNSSSGFIRSLQLTLILLHYHISKRFRYYWSIFRSVQITAPQKSVL